MLCVRIIHSDGFTPDESTAYAKIAVANTLKELDTILKAMKMYNIKFVNEASKVRDESQLDMYVTATFDSVDSLCNSPGTLQCLLLLLRR